MIRLSGVLLHLTSLPSPYGVGDLGPEAHRFLALLAHGDQRRWQMLPLGPTEPGLGNSPYSSYSAFAGHSLLVSPEFLFEDGLLDRADLERAQLPVFDSADVWANQGLFKLDAQGAPTVVAGVPPDYFSATGQRWGNPVYDWARAEAQGFAWWLGRLQHIFGMFDQVRLDHFRGFAAYWEIPAGEPTAVRGRWVFAPGEKLLSRLQELRGEIPLIAEDLGVITPDVVALKEAFGLPGMHVLQFCFGQDSGHNPDAPHNHEGNSVAYVGTHDNNTARGWLRTDADTVERENLRRYLGRRVDESDVAWELIRLVQACPAATAVVTAQDLLSLNERARMNTPGLASGNWSWRLLPGQLNEAALERLGELTAFYGRDGVEILRNDSYEESAAGLGVRVRQD